MLVDERTLLAGLKLLTGPLSTIDSEHALRKAIRIEPRNPPPPEREIQRTLSGTVEKLSSQLSGSLATVPPEVATAPGGRDLRPYLVDLWKLLFFCKNDLSHYTIPGEINEALPIYRKGKMFSSQHKLEFDDARGKARTELLSEIVGWDQLRSDRPLTLHGAIDFAARKDVATFNEFFFSPVSGQDIGSVREAKLKQVDKCIRTEQDLWDSIKVRVRP